jgi:hypothetical protein
VAYKLYIPGGADFDVMPLDFLRGQGIDLIAFFARPTRLFWLDLPWGVRDLDPSKFFSGGQSVKHSYLGIGLIVGMGVFFFCTRFWSSPRLMALPLIAVCALLLSLGPSLKANSQRNSEIADPRDVHNQLMPPEFAVAEMPYAFVYRVMPIKYMRSVGRWHLLSMLCAVAMAAIGLSCISRKNTASAVVATLLVAWIALEYAPDYAARAAGAAKAKASFKRFNSTAVAELNDLLKPSERVVFLGKGNIKNEYMSLYLCAQVGCRTFNAPGDKSLEIARRSWPQPLQKALNRRRPVEEQAALLANLLRSNLVDAVVLANFDLRWDSYGWKPSPVTVAATSDHLLSPYAALTDLYISKGIYFSVVRGAD